MMWKLSNYAFVACACGTKLKIPPSLQLAEITCPSCGKVTPLTAAKPG
jgi:hypothetical protein